MADFIADHGNFKCFSSTWHSYSQLVMYPYGYTMRAGDADELVRVCVSSGCHTVVVLRLCRESRSWACFQKGPVFSLCSLQCAIRPTGNRKKMILLLFCVCCEFQGPHWMLFFLLTCLSDQNVLQIHCSSGTVGGVGRGRCSSLRGVVPGCSVLHAVPP